MGGLEQSTVDKVFLVDSELKEDPGWQIALQRKWQQKMPTSSLSKFETPNIEMAYFCVD
jgi:hypothetical protein